VELVQFYRSSHQKRTKRSTTLQVIPALAAANSLYYGSLAKPRGTNVVGRSVQRGLRRIVIVGFSTSLGLRCRRELTVLTSRVSKDLRCRASFLSKFSSLLEVHNKLRRPCLCPDSAHICRFSGRKDTVPLQLVLSSHGPLPSLLEAPNASESPILFKSYGQTHESEHQTRNRSLRACTEPPAKGTGIVGASVQSGRPKTLASGRPILPRLF
jgi:hypothetical protein